MNKRTRIWAAALLALCMAGAPLWAQSGEWTPWQGKANADKTAWDEMGACWTELTDAYRILNNRAVKGRAYELSAYANYQKDGVKFWKKNKSVYQAWLAKVQPQIAAKQKAEEEQLAAIAAANVKGVTEADFDVDVTRDGKAVIITKYKGMATEVKIPASYQGMPVREIKGGAFSKNETITSVVIPEGVTDVGGFYGCKNLAQVTLPSTLRGIGNVAFSGTALKAVLIPKGVTEIGDSVFRDCKSLASVTIPAGVTYIDAWTFYGCTSLASVTIPGSVTRIGGEAFKGCTSLASLTIAGGVTKMGREAFKDCTSLATVAIQNGVTVIGSDAFSGCKSLETLTIADSVTTIAYEAFINCTSLTTVTISPVKRGFEHSVIFQGCSKLSLASQAALRAAGYASEF